MAMMAIPTITPSPTSAAPSQRSTAFGAVSGAAVGLATATADRVGTAVGVGEVAATAVAVVVAVGVTVRVGVGAADAVCAAAAVGAGVAETRPVSVIGRLRKEGAHRRAFAEVGQMAAELVPRRHARRGESGRAQDAENRGDGDDPCDLPHRVAQDSRRPSKVRYDLVS